MLSFSSLPLLKWDKTILIGFVKCYVVFRLQMMRDAQKCPYAIADNADPDQSAHLRRLIRAFVAHLLNQYIL